MQLSPQESHNFGLQRYFVSNEKEYIYEEFVDLTE